MAKLGWTKRGKKKHFVRSSRLRREEQGLNPKKPGKYREKCAFGLLTHIMRGGTEGKKKQKREVFSPCSFLFLEKKKKKIGSRHPSSHYEKKGSVSIIKERSAFPVSREKGVLGGKKTTASFSKKVAHNPSEGRVCNLIADREKKKRKALPE